MAAKKRRSVNDTAVQRLNVRVTSEAYERLLVHALKARVSPGELVTELIDTGLKRWAMPADLTARSKGTDRPESTGQARESVEPLAMAG